MAFFKTAAKAVQTGNFLVEATCKGTPTHTVYKNQMDDPNKKPEYTCPFKDCGQDVN
jgi:hypothetical protein